jgi:hypothetical protein
MAEVEAPRKAFDHSPQACNYLHSCDKCSVAEINCHTSLMMSNYLQEELGGRKELDAQELSQVADMVTRQLNAIDTFEQCGKKGSKRVRSQHAFIMARNILRIFNVDERLLESYEYVLQRTRF